MDEARFLDICLHAGTALGLADPERLGRDGRIEVDGVHLVVFFDEATLADQVRCYADLGPMPHDDGGAQLRKLLTFNLFCAGSTAGVCAIDPVSGHGLLVVTLWLDNDNRGEHFANALRAVAAQAVAVRESLPVVSAPVVAVA